MTSPQRVHIRADSCARTRLTTSRCDACVRSCPTQAWSLDDEDLSFDPDRCDACGLCVVACPLEAIEADPPALLIGSGSPRTLWLACDRISAPVADGKGQVACLHGLPVTWLLQEARKHGVTRIACASGDCSKCARHSAPEQRLQNRWTEWSKSHPHAAPPPTLVRVAPADWHRQTQDLSAPDTARRRFLSGRFAPTAATAPRHDPRPGDRFGSGKLAEVAPQSGALPLARWQLDWNLQPCTWCMVCVHLCPTLALATSPAGSGHGSQTLNINTNACSGCGLCVDGCDVGALSLRPLARPAPESTRAFPLQRATCGRCKVDFWQPAPVERQSTQGPPVPNAGGAGQKNPICPTCVRGKPRWEQRVIQHQD